MHEWKNSHLQRLLYEALDFFCVILFKLVFGTRNKEDPLNNLKSQGSQDHRKNWHCLRAKRPYVIHSPSIKLLTFISLVKACPFNVNKAVASESGDTNVCTSTKKLILFKDMYI